MADTSTVIEGTVKFRDGKKWKSRWCVMRKLSPVADCLHLQMYRDSKDRYKQGQTKASLSLQHFLGVYSGFTLDKESNTIAIICQDVTVVLAFDTRERLIQWQVKIANNLGEDEQFLVQVASAPRVARGVGVGPARLHVRQHRFCLTVGVPPRLVGHWCIAQLRKYGPVDNKFCFEGGSSCGRGEGLYVLVTDQSENISHAFKMAAEGRLNVRRRPIARNMSVMGGGSLARLSQQVRLDARTSHDDLLGCGWLSAEPGFDSRSTIADDYMQNGGRSLRERGERGELERCSSCISKLGLMSRSTTLTDSNAHSWLHLPDYERRRVTCGSVSLASDYDRTATSSLNYWSSMSSSPPSLGVSERSRVGSLSGRSPRHCHSTRRSPSPTPSTSPSLYGNYDVPKPHCATPRSFQQHECGSQLRRGGFMNGEENYDTPRSVKDSLAPPHPPHHCPPVQHHCTRVVMEEESAHIGSCPCQRVMCWAGVGVSSWMRLPCLIAGALQGHNNGNTRATAIHKVKLDGEGKMPFVNCRGENYTCKPSNGYPTRAILKEEIEEDSEDCKEPLMAKHCTNVKIILESPKEKDLVIQTEPKPMLHYANLEFAKSLEYYENFKDLRRNTELAESMEEKKTPVGKENKPLSSRSCCEKCGHASRSLPPKPGLKNDDYLVMEPTVYRSTQMLQSQPCSPQRSPIHEKISQGYLPMFPIANRTKETHLTEKSWSAPTLPISLRKNIGNRSVHGLAAHSVSETNSPSSRRRLMTSASLTASDIKREPLVPSTRKRSSSMGSARYLDYLASIEEKLISPTRTLVNTPAISNDMSINSLFDISLRQRSIPTSSSEHGLSLVDRSEYITCKSSLTLLDEEPSRQEEGGNDSLVEKIPNPSVHIKRSASIPCRTAYNRDSSGSNDSGVSTGSLRFHKRDFTELDFHSLKKPVQEMKIVKEAVKFDEARVLRRSNSFVPLEELNFELSWAKPPVKSSSAGATVTECISIPENKDYLSPGTVPYVDSHSTSSGTSDMSDYIETLSLSSYTSSDSYQLNHTALNTLRPRSGNEYHTIDRASLKPKISSDQGERKTDDLNI